MCFLVRMECDLCVLQFPAPTRQQQLPNTKLAVERENEVTFPHTQALNFCYLHCKSKHQLVFNMCRRMDYDRDGKLSFDEFLHHAYDIYKSYIEFETQGDDVPTAEEKFDELDLDEDEYAFDLYFCFIPTCWVFIISKNCVQSIDSGRIKAIIPVS